jgi:hypothetical protein
MVPAPSHRFGSYFRSISFDIAAPFTYFDECRRLR